MIYFETGDGIKGDGINGNGNGDRSYGLPVAAVAHLIEFAVGGGQLVFVQVEDSAAGPVTRGIGAQSIAARASQTFEDAISSVRPAAETIVAQLRNLAAAPDEVGIEFGLALSAEVGAFITAASTTANFKVSLTWYRAAAPEAK